MIPLGREVRRVRRVVRHAAPREGRCRLDAVASPQVVAPAARRPARGGSPRGSGTRGWLRGRSARVLATSRAIRAASPTSCIAAAAWARFVSRRRRLDVVNSQSLILQASHKPTTRASMVPALDLSLLQSAWVLACVNALSGRMTVDATTYRCNCFSPFRLALVCLRRVCGERYVRGGRARRSRSLRAAADESSSKSDSSGFASESCDLCCGARRDCYSLSSKW